MTDYIDPDSIGNENDTEDTIIECIDSTREYPLSYSASYYHRDANQDNPEHKFRTEVLGLEY